MTFDERNSWVFGGVILASFIVYAALFVAAMDGTPLGEVAYVTPMLIALGVAVVGSLLGRVAVGIIWSADREDRDERDEAIARLGDRVGNAFVVIGGLAALGMAMAKLDHFWIANTLYLGFIVSGVLGSFTRVVAYRGAFQEW